MDAGQWLEKARAYLERRHVPEPRANAEWLLASALQAGRSELALRERQPLSERQQRNFWGSVEQRARRIP
ncbi:MAG: hypothetical protein KGK30_08430, partial [Elusimicrobia bacterium]|nr:hypothetical protein [Elusimicrobiota bacterium]